MKKKVKRKIISIVKHLLYVPIFGLMYAAIVVPMQPAAATALIALAILCRTLQIKR